MSSCGFATRVSSSVPDFECRASFSHDMTDGSIVMWFAPQTRKPDRRACKLPLDVPRVLMRPRRQLLCQVSMHRWYKALPPRSNFVNVGLQVLHTTLMPIVDVEVPIGRM